MVIPSYNATRAYGVEWPIYHSEDEGNLLQQ